MSVFFNGVKSIVMGFINGIVQMFNIPNYIQVIAFYKEEFGIKEWVLTIIAIAVMIAVLGLIILLVYFIIRKYVRFRKTLVEQEGMLDEIAVLNKKVTDLVEEKEKILAMKVSQMGLKPGESAEEKVEEKPEEEDGEEPKEGEEEIPDDDNIRFTKLHSIDVEFKDYKVQNYNNTFTLEELVGLFRNFAASKLGLYYKTEMIRLFISSLACTKLVILQE